MKLTSYYYYVDEFECNLANYYANKSDNLHFSYLLWRWSICVFWLLYVQFWLNVVCFLNPSNLGSLSDLTSGAVPGVRIMFGGQKGYTGSDIQSSGRVWGELTVTEGEGMRWGCALSCAKHGRNFFNNYTQSIVLEFTSRRLFPWQSSQYGLWAGSFG